MPVHHQRCMLCCKPMHSRLFYKQRDPSQQHVTGDDGTGGTAHQLMTEASLAVSTAASGLGSGRIRATIVAGCGNLPRGWLGVEGTSRRRMGSGNRTAAAEYNCRPQDRHLALGQPSSDSSWPGIGWLRQCTGAAAEQARPSAVDFDGRSEQKQHVHDGKQQPSGGTCQARSQRGATAGHALADSSMANSPSSRRCMPCDDCDQFELQNAEQLLCEHMQSCAPHVNLYQSIHLFARMLYTSV